jgi:hypothetical protein
MRGPIASMMIMPNGAPSFDGVARGAAMGSMTSVVMTGLMGMGKPTTTTKTA